MTAKLSIVLGRHGQVEDIRSGAVVIAGVDLEFRNFERMPDAYRVMARTAEFDICELAPTTYLMAREAGAPITALPLPMTSMSSRTCRRPMSGGHLPARPWPT